MILKDKQPAYFLGLNEQQRQAVSHGSAPLLILAGAGSGKTRVITARIAWMIAEQVFDASSILALTFTNKAALEMRERATKMVDSAANTTLKTFHSFGAWLLRHYAFEWGLSPYFTIYDTDDQVALLGQILGNLSRGELRLWAQRISRAKDEGLGPQDNLEAFSHDPVFPEIYQKYETRLREIGNVDFGDLILLPMKLLMKTPKIKARLQQRFRAILVDEYQDTNVAQYLLLRTLVGPETWLAVVGDDDQSIYRFRGAEVGNILNFQNTFAHTRVIKLEQNYRSTGIILDIASAVVTHNRGRLGKKLWSQGERGEPAIMTCCEDHEAEAAWCANLVDQDGNFGGTAILYRTNAQSRAFETCFRHRDIPYRLVGTLSFYQREEIKDVLAYLAWLSNPKDEVAFRRIANKPTRGFGKKSLDRLTQHSIDNHGGNFLMSCRSAESILKGKALKAARHLAELTEKFIPFDDFDHLGFFIHRLALQSDLLAHYNNIDQIENSQRSDNIEELVSAAAPYPANHEGLSAFMESVELNQTTQEEDDEQNRVTLITMHNTKGLEFPRVIITGMEEGLFPRRDDSPEEEEIEEERRLFYVAITRAQRQLAFTHCRRRMLWGRFRDSFPSRFLQEIPDEFLQEDHPDPSQNHHPWRVGLKICHKDYGLGIINKCLLNNGHTVIHALFDSGRKATLLPDFSSHQIEILGPAGEDQ